MNCDNPHRKLPSAIRLLTAVKMDCVHSVFDIRSHKIGRGRRKMRQSSIAESAETFA